MGQFYSALSVAEPAIYAREVSEALSEAVDEVGDVVAGGGGAEAVSGDFLRYDLHCIDEIDVEDFWVLGLVGAADGADNGRGFGVAVVGGGGRGEEEDGEV